MEHHWPRTCGRPGALHEGTSQCAKMGGGFKENEELLPQRPPALFYRQRYVHQASTVEWRRAAHLRAAESKIHGPGCTAERGESLLHGSRCRRCLPDYAWPD